MAFQPITIDNLNLTQWRLKEDYKNPTSNQMLTVLEGMVQDAREEGVADLELIEMATLCLIWVESRAEETHD